MIETIKKYSRLVVFSHTIFALPFALIGFTLAVSQNRYDFSIERLLLVLVCMVTARNSAMAYNRYLDRKIDAANPRTADREIPAGVISPKRALAFIITNVLIFICACYAINPLCFYLSPIALFVVLGYSWTKRFTSLCHFVLSFGLSIAPMGAYLAVSGEWAWPPLLISAVVLFWVSGFDVIYALQDGTFDKENNLHSIPSRFGIKGALRISELIHTICFICLITAALLLNFGIWAWIGVIIFSGLLIYQHAIVKADDLSQVGRSFGTTNGVASVLLALFVIIDLLT